VNDRYEVNPRHALGLPIPDEYEVRENGSLLCICHAESNAQYIANVLMLATREQKQEAVQMMYPAVAQAAE
jgi:hypothetical protein